MNLAITHADKLKFALIRKAGLLAICCMASVSVHALQLGKHRGAAVIGQPLNIAIQATTDSADELAAGCLDADVFYADNRVEKSRVRISTEKSGANPQEALIRIRTAAVIDEPVVTIYLRTGCAQKVEKRYVVLADVLSESATGGATALPSVPAQTSPVRPVLRADSSAAANAAQASAREERRLEREAQRLEKKTKSAAERAEKSDRAAQAVASTQKSPTGLPAPAEAAQPLKNDKKAIAAAPKTPAVDKQKARLKLEPLELLAERDPSLKTTTELRSAPTSDPAQRSAAAALWRAIAAQPEDILGDSQKLKALESAVSGLQIQMKKNQLDMQNLGGDIDKAQTEKYANPLVFGLSFLLFLAAIGLAVALRKRSSGAHDEAAIQPWWRKGSSERVGWADSAENLLSPASSSQSTPESVASSMGSHKDAPLENYLDLDLSDDGSKSARQPEKRRRTDEAVLLSPHGTRRSGPADEPTIDIRADFLQSASSGGRAVKAEELFDVQQQADFFVSLGQKDQAIEVLRSHIEESEETSALVYLDLLKLYHQLDERLEFEAFRQEFNAKFNAEMPEFEAYTEAATGEGLQAYPLAMSRIVALWPSSKVLNVIEESMFRQPDLQTAAFDLEAYRELLLLYAMIKDILHAQSAGKGPTVMASSQRTSVGLSSGYGENGRHREDTHETAGSNFASTSVVPLVATGELPAVSRAASLPFDVEVEVDVDLDSLGNFDTPKVDVASKRSSLAKTALVSSQQGASSQQQNRNGKLSKLDENSIDFDFDQPATADFRPKK